MSKSYLKLLSFENNSLFVLSKRHQVEILKFKIVDQLIEIINGVKHTKFISNNNDIFYVVNGKFHREDDQPAVICSLYVLNSYTKQLKKSKCEMFFKNGFFHRNQDILPFKTGCFSYQYINPNFNLSDFFKNLSFTIKNRLTTIS